MFSLDEATGARTRHRGKPSCCGIGIGIKANGLRRTFDVEHKGCLWFYVFLRIFLVDLCFLDKRER